MPHIKTSPPNAIVFILDPTSSDIVVPEYEDGAIVQATSTCVSVATQPDVDGPTGIWLETGISERALLTEVFNGQIKAPGGHVVVVTSAFERLLETKVHPGTVEIRVWTDDRRSPSRVVISAASVRA